MKILNSWVMKLVEDFTHRSDLPDIIKGDFPSFRPCISTLTVGLIFVSLYVADWWELAGLELFLIEKCWMQLHAANGVQKIVDAAKTEYALF